MIRPYRPAVPPMPPFDRLDAAHALLSRHLDALGVLVERLRQEGTDAIVRHAARELHDFFERTARAHHDDEERHVFPHLLAAADAAMARDIRRLRQDHGWLERDWRAIGDALMAIAEGRAGWDPDALRHAVRAFRALYTEHIALEESLVYPAARRAAGTVTA